MKPVDIITTVLGFHRLRARGIRDKMHLLLEICIFFIFDFSERLIVLLFT